MRARCFSSPIPSPRLSGNTLTGGTWNALDGATLEFPIGTAITSNEGNISLTGSGAAVIGIGAGDLQQHGNLSGS